MTIDDYMKTEDTPAARKATTAAYWALRTVFDEKKFEFSIPQNKRDYGIRFVINDNLYRDGTFLRGEIQYNWTRDNLIDFNTCQGIDRTQFIAAQDDPMKIYFYAFYAEWTDPAHHYGMMVQVSPGVLGKKGRMPKGQVLYKTKGMYRAKGAR